MPAENPRLVILISVDNPEGGHYGNEVAALQREEARWREAQYARLYAEREQALLELADVGEFDDDEFDDDDFDDELDGDLDDAPDDDGLVD